jgi:hypothetical protein
MAEGFAHHMVLAASMLLRVQMLKEDISGYSGMRDYGETGFD